MAPLSNEVENHTAFLDNWVIADKLAPHFYSIYCNTKEGIHRSMLFVHSIHLFTHRNLSKAKQFLELHPDSSSLVTIADKLKYYRYTHELLQKDVAELLSIDRQTYASMEDSNRDIYDIELLKRLAKIYKISVEKLLDDYHLFLFNGAGIQIKALRKSLRITQRELAHLLNVDRNTVMYWEHEYHSVPPQTYQLLFHTPFLAEHTNS